MGRKQRGCTFVALLHQPLIPLALTRIWPAVFFLVLLGNSSLAGKVYVVDDPVKDTTVARSQALDDSTQSVYYREMAYQYWDNSPKKADESAQQAYRYAVSGGYPSLAVDALNARLVANAMMGQYDSAIAFAEEALQISQQLDAKNKAVSINMNLAVIYKNQGKYEQALYYNAKNLQFYEETGDTLNASYTRNNIGLVYLEKGDYVNALENLQESLSLKRAIDDTTEINSTLTNIGSVYKELQLYDDAREYYLQSIAITLSQSDSSSLALAFNNMAEVELLDNNLVQAKTYNNKTIAIQESANLTPGLVSSYKIRGDILQAEEQYDSASQYYNHSYALAEVLQDKKGMANALMGNAQVLAKEEQYMEALQIALSVRGMAEALGTQQPKMENNLLLSEIYEAIGQYEESLRYLEGYLAIYKSTTSRESIQRAEASRYEAEIEQQKAELALAKKTAELNAKDLEISQSANARQRLLLIFGGFGLVLTLVLLIVLYRFYDSKRKSHRLLEVMNTEVLRQKKEIETINENLDHQVKERTRELEKRNQKLFEYALINAHNIRGPLANILGLLRLMERHEDNPAMRQEIKQKLEYSAQMLDDSIHEINSMLEEDKLYVLSKPKAPSTAK